MRTVSTGQGLDGSRQDRFFIYDGGISENCFQDVLETALRVYLKQQYGLRQKLYDSHKEYAPICW